MDTSEYPSLPNLAQVHARLASNSRRVEAAVDAQLDGIERLFTATTTGDWEAIAQVSRYLAKQDPAHLDGEVIRQARQVCDELARALRAESEGRLLVSGPGPAPVERVKGRYRMQIKAGEEKKHAELLTDILAQSYKEAGS